MYESGVVIAMGVTFAKKMIGSRNTVFFKNVIFR